MHDQLLRLGVDKVGQLPGHGHEDVQPSVAHRYVELPRRALIPPGQLLETGLRPQSITGPGGFRGRRSAWRPRSAERRSRRRTSQQ